MLIIHVTVSQCLHYVAVARFIFSFSCTGLDPITYLEIHQSSSGNARAVIVQVESIWELITKESYLTFAILFICLKIIMCFFPLIYLRFKSFWVSHVWPVNLRILHESSLLLEKVLQVVDIKRMWSNIQLSNKTRNFQKGANNARVWASSLTRLNESSSSRLALKDSQFSLISINVHPPYLSWSNTSYFSFCSCCRHMESKSRVDLEY